MKTNAKEELLEFLMGCKKRIEGKIIGITILYTKPNHFNGNIVDTYHVFNYHQNDDLNEYLNLLDFEYEGRWDELTIAGTIWFSDGNYAHREDFDGQEWWHLHQAPMMVFFKQENFQFENDNAFLTEDDY